MCLCKICKKYFLSLPLEKVFGETVGAKNDVFFSLHNGKKYNFEKIVGDALKFWLGVRGYLPQFFLYQKKMYI